MPTHPTSAQAVIGANYGDEGKGLLVDKLTSETKDKTLVIRHNSSAQAGHTVTTPEGKRHIFHHIGSGSFLGADTFLSRFFVTHPMYLQEELVQLKALSVQLTIYIDERSHIATPFDAAINQIAENTRGNKRHGSCGIGFGEAVERSIRPKFALQIHELSNRIKVRNRLQSIQQNWIPNRLEILDLSPSEEDQELLYSEQTTKQFLTDIEYLLDTITTIAPGDLPPCNNIIFEGAQGLALAEDSKDFPHVTRSKTGLANAVTIAQETGISNIHTNYITRCYLTRHGAGPLKNEYKMKPYENIKDPTNIPNEFQGSLRFADLNLDDMINRIKKDLTIHASGITISAAYAITCLDQVPDKIWIIDENERKQINKEKLPEILYRKSKVKTDYTSFGPTRNDCTKH